jgi:hypothetical protein
VHGHGLRGVFYTASNPKLSAGAKRIIDIAMTSAAASDPIGVPAHHLIEEAHAPLVGNVALDPSTI